MIKVEACRGCGRLIYSDTFCGIRIRADTEPLEANGATRALIEGVQLYRVTFLGGRPVDFSSASTAVLGKLRTERPLVVREHACTAAGGAATPFRGLGVADTAARPPQAPCGPFHPVSGSVDGVIFCERCGDPGF